MVEQFFGSVHHYLFAMLPWIFSDNQRQLQQSIAVATGAGQAGGAVTERGEIYEGGRTDIHIYVRTTASAPLEAKRKRMWWIRAGDVKMPPTGPIQAAPSRTWPISTSWPSEPAFWVAWLTGRRDARRDPSRGRRSVRVGECGPRAGRARGLPAPTMPLNCIGEGEAMSSASRRIGPWVEGNLRRCVTVKRDFGPLLANMKRRYLILDHSVFFLQCLSLT